MGAARLQWVVCRSETRSVHDEFVACPLRGRVSGAACLACRFLMTSSIERAQSGWCETSADQPVVARGPVAARPAISTAVVRVQPAPRRPVAVVVPGRRAARVAPRSHPIPVG
jgi:hypothetical protein